MYLLREWICIVLVPIVCKLNILIINLKSTQSYRKINLYDTYTILHWKLYQSTYMHIPIWTFIFWLWGYVSLIQESCLFKCSEMQYEFIGRAREIEIAISKSQRKPFPLWARYEMNFPYYTCLVKHHISSTHNLRSSNPNMQVDQVGKPKQKLSITVH